MKKRWGNFCKGAMVGVLLVMMCISQGEAAPINTQIKMEKGLSQFVLEFNDESAPQIGFTLIHLVKKGDTAWSISEKYGVSVNELIKLNKLNIQKPLLVNQRVIVPAKSTPAVQSKGQKQVQLYLYIQEKDAPLIKKETNESKAVKSHLVQKGETIFSIAKKYKINEEELRQANGLTEKSYLLAGQTLNVPQISYHSVKQGETLTQISRKYHTSVQQLLSVNSLKLDEHIVPGQQLKIVN